jgi:hypothetical protein
MSSKNTIHGVEIFAAGVHNGDSFTERDLDDLVASYEDLDYKPAVKLGHTDSPGAMAYGWVGRVYRRGRKLLADLYDVPAEVFAAIKQRRYDRVSAEIYFNLKRGGQVFRRALKAVALLGAEIPAVAGLAPLRTVVNTAGAAPARTYHFGARALQHEDIGSEVDQLVREHMERHEEPSYSKALDAVLKEDPDLAVAYALPSDNPNPHSGKMSPPPTRPESENAEADRRQAGEELTKIAKQLQHGKTDLDFLTAFEQACHQHPHLAARYHGHDYR